MSDNDLLEKMKETLDSLLPPSDSLGSYPQEAVPMGTWVRSVRHDKLCVVVDAFYGDLDADNKKIIIYSLLLFPKPNLLTTSAKKKENLYLSNEYEYEVIAYLMLNPVDVKKLSQTVGGLFI